MSLSQYLDKASKAYYEGNPIISDIEFDFLAASCNYNKIGYSKEGGIKHLYKMHSLQKFYEGETPSPLKQELLVETPKLDGSAISLLYIEGELQQILTRGDGKIGQDISHLIPGFRSKIVPAKIKLTDVIQVDGEVVAPSSIPNARNYASGALGLLSTEEFSNRELTFAAYSLRPFKYETYLEDIEALKDEGFKTVLHDNWEAFPQDGKVFRLNDNSSYLKLGFTATHPRGAYALKKRTVGEITTLKDVVWQVGKSGIIAPVAILEPVIIEDAKVSRATLHNMSYINALNLEIGCEVEVVRSGSIIPRIVRRVDKK